MPQPSSYQLLKDIHLATENLEKKMDARILDIEERVNGVEEKTDNLLGKIGIGIMVMSALISGAVSLVIDWFKKL